MIREATLADLEPLTTLLRRANNTPHDLVRVAQEKCFGEGMKGAPAVRVFGDFAGVSVTCGEALRILAVAPEQRRHGIGSALLRDAESRGVSLIGAEAGNYFTPGVLASDAATIAFFRSRGYQESARTLNLEAEPQLSDPFPDVRRATHSDRQRVLDFIRHDFGAIWQFEASHAFDAVEPTIFYAEENGTVVGFAAHDVNNRGLGWFGPTGVRKSLRGKGIGSRLLRASLGDLRRLGYSRVVIPWTDAVEFYQRACGARVTEHFVVLRAAKGARRGRGGRAPR